GCAAAGDSISKTTISDRAIGFISKRLRQDEAKRPLLFADGVLETHDEARLREHQDAAAGGPTEVVEVDVGVVAKDLPLVDEDESVPRIPDRPVVLGVQHECAAVTVAMAREAAQRMVLVELRQIPERHGFAVDRLDAIEARTEQDRAVGAKRR